MFSLIRFLKPSGPCERSRRTAPARLPRRGTSHVGLFASCRSLRIEALEDRRLLTAIPAGAVSGTWTAANSPYVHQGNVTVNSGTSLTIQSGVTVQSASGQTYNLQFQTGSTGSISTASFTSASLTISDPSVAVTGSTFASTVYCPAAFVPQLANNSKFRNRGRQRRDAEPEPGIGRAGQRHGVLPVGQQPDHCAGFDADAGTGDGPAGE